MGVFDFLHQPFEFLRTRPDEKPKIPPSTAVVLSIVFTLIYVIPFYLVKTTRPSPDLTRDAPSVVKARIRSVTISCIIAACVVVFVLKHDVKLKPREILHELGWWGYNPLDVPRVLALLSVLFVARLFEAAIVEGQWRDWIRFRGATYAFRDPIWWRNYVAGPVSEELLFRSFIIPLHVAAKFTVHQIIFLTPLYFGVAHMHHFYEFRLTHPQTPLIGAILRTVVQFSYTTVFGFFAAFVYLRTGNLPAAIAAHSFCNWMGLPRFWGRVEAPISLGPQDFEGTELTDLESDGNGTTKRLQLNYGRLPIWYTIVYYLLLVGGAVGFSQLLWLMTESQQYAILYFETLRIAW